MEEKGGPYTTAFFTNAFELEDALSKVYSFHHFELVVEVSVGLDDGVADLCDDNEMKDMQRGWLECGTIIRDSVAAVREEENRFVHRSRVATLAKKMHYLQV
ncbi:hypothetical protein VNO80_25533 [Phaseolus coccineus]|uniref:Uncharacterized protein n=1 Tax=Phaseolus coccineus TaxID=3886 RepID=A0AAN9LZN1_PHACN